MQVDTVMSLASMIAATVTAIAAVHGEWSWTVPAACFFVSSVLAWGRPNVR